MYTYKKELQYIEKILTIQSKQPVSANHLSNELRRSLFFPVALSSRGYNRFREQLQ